MDSSDLKYFFFKTIGLVENKELKLYDMRFCQVFFFKFFLCHSFHLKQLEIIQFDV